MNTRQLYKISKFAFQEAFLESQLEMAGSSQSRIMEQMEKNHRYIKTQNITMKIVLVIYIGMMIIFPIMAFQSITNAQALGISTEWILFAGSLVISISLLLELIYLLMFGMFFAASLLSGGAFQWLMTLPLNKTELHKITLFTFLQGMNVQIITMLFVLPLGVAIGSGDFLLTLISIPLSILNVLFSFGLLVIIGERVNRVLKEADVNSKKNTFLRILVLGGYAVVTMAIAVGLQFAFRAIGALFQAEALNDDTTELLNYILTTFPYPFNLAYLLMRVHLNYFVNPSVCIPLLVIGSGIFLLITLRVYKHALNRLNNVVFPKIKMLQTPERIITIDDIHITTVSPIQAFFNKDKQMATRDIQVMMLIIMPIILPLVGIFTSQVSEASPEEAVLVMLLVNSLYTIMSAFMIMSGLLGIETTGSSVLASLPIVIRDQAKAKYRWILIILPIANLLPLLFYIGQPNFWDISGVILTLLPIGPLFAMLLMLLKVRFFGKLRYKYVLEEVQLRYKFWKWLFLIVLALIIYGVIITSLIIFFEFLSGPIFLDFIGIYISSELIFIGIYIPSELIIAGILYYFYNRMFPKPNLQK